MQFLAMIEDMSFLKVASVGPRDMKAGAALLRRFADQDLTMVDAVGLHLLEEHACAACWSTDFHLGLTGVPLVIHMH